MKLGREGKERYTKSQVGLCYVSAILGADPVGPISTKIGKSSLIIHSNFRFNIFRDFRSTLQGVKISVFPLTFLVIVTTRLPLPRSLW